MKKPFTNIVLAFATIFTLCLSFLLLYPMIKSKTASLFLDEIILIDPGHGGKDDGASCDDVQEDEINLKIASKLYELIIGRGGMAFILRTGDYDLASLYATNRKREDLNKRVEYINHSGASLFISIHLNSYGSASVHGPMVYYRKNDSKSKILGECVLEQLNALTTDDKIVHGEDYFLFRKTSLPGILVECGFITNTEERRKLLTEDYQNKIAQAILTGVRGYLNG